MALQSTVLFPQAHGVAIEAPTGGARAAAAVGSHEEAGLRCLLFGSLEAGTQYCEERFLQVLSSILHDTRRHNTCT